MCMSTRLGRWGSGAVEIATRKSHPFRVVRDLRKPTHYNNKKLPVTRKQPSAGLDPITAHPIPIYLGVGPRTVSPTHVY